MAKNKILFNNAKDNLKNHSYSLLTQSENAEIWQCSQNNSSFYAFNIAIMPYGIAVVGDIGELTFNVYNRGIDFLAGNDVEYYIHSKLSENCKIEDFDKSNTFHIIETVIKYDFDNNENFLNYLNEEDLSLIQSEIKDLNLQDITSYFENFLIKFDINSTPFNFFTDLLNFLNEALLLDTAEEYYELLDNYSLLSFDETMCLSDFLKPSDTLIEKLYMINIAAKEIISLYY